MACAGKAQNSVLRHQASTWVAAAAVVTAGREELAAEGRASRMAQAEGEVQTESTVTEAAVLVLQFLTDSGFVRTTRAFKRCASCFISLLLRASHALLQRTL